MFEKYRGILLLGVIFSKSIFIL